MHRTLRLAVTAVATGALFGSAALASALQSPTDPPLGGDAVSATSPGASQSPVAALVDEMVAADEAAAEHVVAFLEAADLDEGQLLVGAAKRNLYPQPDEAAGEYWERDPDKCNQVSEHLVANIADQGDHLMTAGSTWPENPNCIYQGGFGIGPMNGVSDFDGGEPKWLPNNPITNAVYPGNDALGIWVRSISISDGEDTLLLSIVDGEGWLWEYGNKGQQYGAKQIGLDIAEELSADGYPVSAEGVVLAATHTHAGPEFLGAWGFVPDWYMEDVRALVMESKRTAVETAAPAVVEVGEETARRWNSERRDTYRSAEEQQLGWFRAVDAESGDVIATLGTYAAHPTRFGTNGNVAHPDWPGLFTKAAEDRFGGVGLLFMTGLGNMSGSGPKEIMGLELVRLIPPVGEGELVDGTDVRLTQSLWRQPVTNVPLTALGVPGFADRQFDLQPASVSVGKSDGSPCTSAAPYSVELPALAAWIGSDIALTTGPGELFANGTNTVKDESGARIAFPLAQANDALGYMPQSFEFAYTNQQGAGFAAGGFAGVNYEDSYAIDACTGDMWLETTLDALAAIR